MTVTFTGPAGLVILLLLLGVVYVLVARAVRWGRNMSVRDLCDHDWGQVASSEYSDTFRCRKCRAKRVDNRHAHPPA